MTWRRTNSDCRCHQESQYCRRSCQRNEKRSELDGNHSLQVHCDGGIHEIYRLEEKSTRLSSRYHGRIGRAASIPSAFADTPSHTVHLECYTANEYMDIIPPRQLFSAKSPPKRPMGRHSEPGVTMPISVRTGHEKVLISGHADGSLHLSCCRQISCDLESKMGVPWVSPKGYHLSRART